MKRIITVILAVSTVAAVYVTAQPVQQPVQTEDAAWERYTATVDSVYAVSETAWNSGTPSEALAAEMNAKRVETAAYATYRN